MTLMRFPRTSTMNAHKFSYRTSISHPYNPRTRNARSRLLTSRLCFASSESHVAMAMTFNIAFADMELSVKELVPLVRHQLIAKCFNVASGVVLLFDTFENFADEVDLIWCQRWSVGKALYIASRYLAFIDLSIMLLYLFDSRLEPKICHRLYKTTTYFTLIGACTAERTSFPFPRASRTTPHVANS